MKYIKYPPPLQILLAICLSVCLFVTPAYANVTDNVAVASIHIQLTSIFDLVKSLVDNLSSAQSKINNLQSELTSVQTAVSNGKTLLADTLGIDTSSGLPTFDTINSSIATAKSLEFERGQQSALACPTGSFATCATWAEVQAVVKSGRAAEQFTVGETRTITLPSITNIAGTVYTPGTTTITLVDMSNDGKDITCMFTGYEVDVCCDVDTGNTLNAGGYYYSWEKCEIRTWLNGSGFYNKLPSDLKQVICETDVFNCNHKAHYDHTIVTNITTDKLYLPSIKEIRGTCSLSLEDQNLSQLKYFSDNLNDNNSALTNKWIWTRSAVSSSECYIHAYRQYWSVGPVLVEYYTDTYPYGDPVIYPLFHIK